MYKMILPNSNPRSINYRKFEASQPSIITSHTRIPRKKPVKSGEDKRAQAMLKLENERDDALKEMAGRDKLLADWVSDNVEPPEMSE